MKLRLLSLGVLMTGILPDAGFAQWNQQPTTPAAQYFANRSAQVQHVGTPTMGAYLPPPQQVQVAGVSKPFQHVQQQPTLSPYLGLDIIPESGTSLPNYHMFVRPQVQQRAAYDAQSRELQRLRQQVRVATARGVVSKNPTGGMPTTGGSSQFLNVGNYFPGLK